MAPYLLFADLPHVLETRAIPLRRMLDRGNFTLHDADCKQGSGNWTRFTIADAVNLAIIRAGVKLGQKVRTASDFAQFVIERGGVELTDLDAFEARWQGAFFIVETIDTHKWAYHGIIERDAASKTDFSTWESCFTLIPIGSIVVGTIARARQILAREKAA